MISISKSKLKAHMLRIFREIEESGEELIITDRGRPVLTIKPIKKKRNVRDVFADLQGRATFLEDPTVPTTDEWDSV